MKKSKFIVILFTVAILAVVVALLVGCDDGTVTYEYDYIVTFDYNVDKLGVPTNCETQYLGVNDGYKIFEPGSLGDTTFPKFEVDSFYNEGWYTADVDEEGNVVLKDKWNFETDVVHGDMTLYANFLVKPTLTIIVDGGDDVVLSREPGATVSKPTSTSSSVPKLDGYTFIDCYTDETYTTKIFPYTFTTENEVCYALMLKGTWSVVTNVDNFLSALVGNRSMFLDVESGQLDFAGRNNLSGYLGINYNSVIYGNDCVIKNFNISATFSRTITNYALFANLGAKAEIHDLTFENMSMSFTLNQLTDANFKAALFAINIEQGATFDNLKFTNCSLTYDGRSSFEVTEYKYYVTCAGSYSCFDDSQITVTNNVAKI